MNFFKRTDYDFISIGDTTTDAFIRLNAESARIEQDHGSGKEICMRFGDKIPYDDVYIVPGVGNAANAAVSASRLGLKTAFVSNIGNDEQGKEILRVMQRAEVSTDFITAHKDKKTNYHYVLWYGDERTILLKHEAYEYVLPNIGEPKWIYFSSIGENALVFHERVAEYLKAHPSIKLAFQPGTFQIKFGKENLKRIYKRTDVFFSNKDEAEHILETSGVDIKKLLPAIAALGPRMVFITDGTQGAYAYDGNEMFRMPLYPDPKPPLQRTGAGDAFSSTVTVALALGKSVREALQWGPINSMSVVQGIGAQAGLLTRDKLEEFLRKAPIGYEPQPL